MVLYKYKALDNLWHVLDIIINQRVYCANWWELNDPLEGKFEIYLGDKPKDLEPAIRANVEAQRDKLRVASFSSDSTNFLLWSHYANGHKGCAIEVSIDDEDTSLQEVGYHPFSSIITSLEETEMNMFHLFNSKNDEWEYESEYRLITTQEFYRLDAPVTKMLLGPMVSEDQIRILENIIPDTCDLVRTRLDETQGRLEIVEPGQ